MDKINLFIISYNRLSFLQKQLDVLLLEPRIKITILDNRSTYAPLLSFYKQIAHQVRTIVQDKNYGHTVPWDKDWTKIIAKDQSYFVTDSDIIPKEGWFDILFQGLAKYPEVNKVGLGLRLNDIPFSVPFRKNIVQHEDGYIYKKNLPDVRFALMPVDTTLALYRGGYHDYSIWGTKSSQFEKSVGCKAIRTTYPWQARHLSWYMTLEDIQSEENKFYLSSLKEKSTHWSEQQKILIDGNNNL